MCAAWRTLSNGQRRTASIILSDDLLPSLQSADTFMALFLAVVQSDAKAHLGTFLKAAVSLCRRGTVCVTDPRWEQFGATCTPIDARKTLDALVPLAKTPEETVYLVRALANDNLPLALHALQRAATVPAYFVLFQTLRQEEGNAALLREHYTLLLRRATPAAFRLASVLRTYFSLPDLPGRFSLTLEPFQLSALETSFEAFAKTINP